MGSQQTSRGISGQTSAKQIEINDRFRQALDVMENTDKNVFITGKAGTGKSTLLEYFREVTKKRIAVLAPTGVAALNVRGQTIHSFFGFKPDITLQTVEKSRKDDLYASLDAIVIDEISMVRADLLDCTDKSLRLNRVKSKPFGGVQMIFIGDLYQLPPVVTGREKTAISESYKTPYFFDSNAFRSTRFEFLELEKIYRQKDQNFIELLNAIRNRSVTDEHMITLNRRFNPFFEPDTSGFFIYLTTTNDMAAGINSMELAKLKGETRTYKGKFTGKFDETYLPTDIELNLKPGSQIMMVNNDSGLRWVNGTVGRIKSIEKSEKQDIINVGLSDGKVAEVEPYKWSITRLNYNKSLRMLESETVGTFTQYPMRLAWAVTIHKSQGKTFDNVIIDIGRGTFSHGQVYVALSRCTSLEGIVLKKPIEKKHIFMDWRVSKFLTEHQYKLSNEKLPIEAKMEIIEKAIKAKAKLKIVYLKSNDTKSERVIKPEFVGEMEYLGRTYIGVSGFCYKRKEDRTFRLDRILEMEEVGQDEKQIS